jgi:hypothetical protein
MEALFNACASREKNAQQAWSSVKSLLQEIDPDVLPTTSIRYDWVLGGFKIDK